MIYINTIFYNFFKPFPSIFLHHIFLKSIHTYNFLKNLPQYYFSIQKVVYIKVLKSELLAHINVVQKGK